MTDASEAKRGNCVADYGRDACIDPLAFDHVKVRSADTAARHLNEELALDRLRSRSRSPLQGTLSQRGGCIEFVRIQGGHVPEFLT
jgi:hypothetical protein